MVKLVRKHHKGTVVDRQADDVDPTVITYRVNVAGHDEMTDVLREDMIIPATTPEPKKNRRSVRNSRKGALSPRTQSPTKKAKNQVGVQFTQDTNLAPRHLNYDGQGQDSTGWEKVNVSTRTAEAGADDMDWREGSQQGGNIHQRARGTQQADPGQPWGWQDGRQQGVNIHQRTRGTQQADLGQTYRHWDQDQFQQTTRYQTTAGPEPRQQ